jgi:hypothetical protein
MANTHFVYRNLNTNQEVARAERSARFDALPNWVLVAIPDDLGKPQPVIEPKPDDTKTPGLIGSSQVAGGTPETPKAPPKNAPKDEWVEYALAKGGDPAKVADMRRDDLIAEFGE